MADVSDSRLADAYAAVRSDSDPTTWYVSLSLRVELELLFNHHFFSYTLLSESGAD
jgi:hypothetical protein